MIHALRAIYKATVIKRSVKINRQMNGTEYSLEVDRHICAQLIFDKGAEAIQRRKYSCLNK